ncbi:MAG: ribosome silencing factor [Gemmatimonadales bacterium]|jgi:ribosome-associated protein
MDNGGAENARHLQVVVTTLNDHKAKEIVVLDLRELSDATDYFIVASGSSDVHVRAIAEHVQEALRACGRRAHHVEGLRAGRWALLDYVDFVVHIFHPTLRDFYQLERLWSDAPSAIGGIP